ncbi:hypothetical protein EV360DRAFT_73281 [Lentinula raphanica]|nr:hypothetical protein EV360DRAFT_73281 [Lentinula raphanica]
MRTGVKARVIVNDGKKGTGVKARVIVNDGLGEGSALLCVSHQRYTINPASMSIERKQEETIEIGMKSRHRNRIVDQRSEGVCVRSPPVPAGGGGDNFEERIRGGGGMKRRRRQLDSGESSQAESGLGPILQIIPPYFSLIPALVSVFVDSLLKPLLVKEYQSIAVFAFNKFNLDNALHALPTPPTSEVTRPPDVVIVKARAGAYPHPEISGSAPWPRVTTDSKDPNLYVVLSSPSASTQISKEARSRVVNHFLKRPEVKAALGIHSFDGILVSLLRHLDPVRDQLKAPKPSDEKTLYIVFSSPSPERSSASLDEDRIIDDFLKYPQMKQIWDPKEFPNGIVYIGFPDPILDKHDIHFSIIGPRICEGHCMASIDREQPVLKCWIQDAIGNIVHGVRISD